MQFLLLLYGDEAAELALTDDERRTIVEEHMAYARTLRDLGHLVGGEALAPSPGAAVVRRSGVSDGPFIETKEQLGGFYLVECADRAAAIELARGVPDSPGLVVEVRAVAT